MERIYGKVMENWQTIKVTEIEDVLNGFFRSLGLGNRHYSYRDQFVRNSDNLIFNFAIVMVTKPKGGSVAPGLRKRYSVLCIPKLLLRYFRR